MRALLLTSSLLMALTGCSTEIYELLGDAGGDLSAKDGPRADTAPPADSAPDTRPNPDTSPPRPDVRAPCVCRYRACRDNGDCQNSVGSNSTCEPSTSLCSGGVGTCTSSADCGSPAQWACTKGADTLDTCGTNP